MRELSNIQDRSRLLPFFWLKGEDEATLREGVRQVAASGCGAIVAESRPHPDYLGPTWWRDLGIVLEECERLGMKLWVLDDQHFPSGYAAGRAKGTAACRMMMTERHMDVRGPAKGGSFMVQDDETSYQPGEGVVAVIAARRLDESNRIDAFVDIGGYKLGERVDLTGKIHDGMAYWDVPEGIWRIFVLKARYVSERIPPRFFANPLMPEGGQLMLDTVYQPHFEHFGDQFGKTFMGFFSDEPALRAGRGYHAILGEYPNLPIPWRTDMPALLSDALGTDASTLLPGLWYDIGEDTRRIRYALMDTASRLYGENYSMLLGNWCRDHGVEYIGHVIEQNNTHARLGSGAGHFFRAISGQDMAGLDIVLHEVRPDLRGGTHAWNSQDFEADDDFFRYMLAQMAVSAAHLDPHKAGRTLCEIFGAYGWQEDVAEMRYLANFLLARGVNYFTPHAFTMDAYPDEDSPPHFDAVNNPLMPFIARLFDAMVRYGDMIDGGRHIARAAVLYHAEGEWASGAAGCMRSQAVVKVLNDSQMECEIVPIDLLNTVQPELLFIPWAQSWPKKLLDACHALRAAGKKVYFIDAFPTAISEGEGDLAALLAGFETLPLAQAAQVAQRAVPLLYRAACQEDRVHLYPYAKGDDLVFLLFNEDTRESVDYSFFIDDARPAYCVDQERMRCLPVEGGVTEEGRLVSLRLEPAQLLAVLVTDQPVRCDTPEPVPSGVLPLNTTWDISLRAAGEDAFTHYAQTDAFINITAPDRLPRFAGTVRYEANVTVPTDCVGLDLGACAGSTQAWLDGKEIDIRVAPPYRLTAHGLAAGGHRLVIEVTNAPVFRHRDPLSFFGYIPPTGIQGPVTWLTMEGHHGG